ncbi:MAG TPA: DUF896 domain-containing protein [Bacillota bacterium]|nr:DUF896 domain-containing protein [Bacillota bacterium]
MLEKDKLMRLNELAQREKEGGLTPSEAIEQKNLRSAYVKAFRSNMESQLKSMGMERKVHTGGKQCQCGCALKH